MKISEEIKVSEVVTDNIKTADIFKKFGIDFCCGGGVSIAKACEKNNIDLDTLLNELNNLNQEVIPSENYNAWTLDFLIDYIINTHHIYVIESFNLLDDYMTKVVRVHGEHHQPLIEIQAIYERVKSELINHLMKEEKILFPYVKQLVIADSNATNSPDAHFGSVQFPINVMEQEHEYAGDLMKEISLLTNKYTPPEWACNTFKALYSKLDEFEQDLHRHVHLENNILFPKAIALEEKLHHLN